MRPKVKICGVCRPQDAVAATNAGAAYLGVILAAGFPRTRTLDDAAAIFAASPDALRVGVFVDDDSSFVIGAAQRLLLDVVQLHGAEAPERLAVIRAAGPWEVWKSVRPRTSKELRHAAATYDGFTDGLLVDGWSEKGIGGIGARVDWESVTPHGVQERGHVTIVAAGGLRPDNVADVIRRLSPDVVDVSSGVEESLGRKSEALMRAFVDAAHDTEARTP